MRSRPVFWLPGRPSFQDGPFFSFPDGYLSWITVFLRSRTAILASRTLIFLREAPSFFRSLHPGDSDRRDSLGAAIQRPERSSWLRRRHPAARELIEGLEHLLGPGADPVVAGEVDPPHGTAGVDQNLRRTGDVLAVDPGPLVQKAIAADDRGIRVAQEGIRPPGLGEVLARNLGRVRADPHRPDAARLKAGKLLLEAP